MKVTVSSIVTVLLTIAWYIVAFVMALTVGLALLSVFHDFGASSQIEIPVSFSVDAEALNVRAPALGIETAQIRNVRGSLLIPPPASAPLSGPLITPALTAGAIMLGIGLWVLGQLRAVFRTVRDGQPFVPVNAIRIRRIGFLVIAGECARAAVVFASNTYVTTHFSAVGLLFDARPDLHVLTIIHGLIILAIAEVFRAGTQLYEDQSLTI